VLLADVNPLVPGRIQSGGAAHAAGWIEPVRAVLKRQRLAIMMVNRAIRRIERELHERMRVGEGGTRSIVRREEQQPQESQSPQESCPSSKSEANCTRSLPHDCFTTPRDYGRWDPQA
jgi:hypothetical protein